MNAHKNQNIGNNSNVHLHETLLPESKLHIHPKSNRNQEETTGCECTCVDVRTRQPFLNSNNIALCFLVPRCSETIESRVR